VPAGVQPGHAEGVLGRLGPAVGEEHLVEVARRPLGQHAGQLAAGRVGVARGDHAEHVGLRLDGGHHPRVLVADVHVHHLRREVEVATTVLVPHPAALGAGHHHGVERILRGPRVEDMGSVVEIGLASLAFGLGHGVLQGTWGRTRTCRS
jgi:hypothetical protein